MTLDDGESILQYVEIVILDLVVHRMFFWSKGLVDSEQI